MCSRMEESVDSEAGRGSRIQSQLRPAAESTTSSSFVPFFSRLGPCAQLTFSPIWPRLSQIVRSVRDKSATTIPGRRPLPHWEKILVHNPGSNMLAANERVRRSELPFGSLPRAVRVADYRDRRFAACRGGRHGGPRAFLPEDSIRN